NVQAKYATTAKKPPKMIDSVLGLIKFAIRVHQSYFGIGYTSSPPSHFRYPLDRRPKLYPGPSRERSRGGLDSLGSRPSGRVPLTRFRTRERRSAARELAI